MKKIISLVVASCFFLCNADASDVDSKTDVGVGADGSEVAAEIDNARLNNINVIARADFCFLSGTPPSDFKYEVVRKLKLGKKTYGGVKDILPAFADKAHDVGADAVINYTGSQRFGFLPWRMVRPVVTGVAVKWLGLTKPDCTAVGGSTLKQILVTDKAPD